MDVLNDPTSREPRSYAFELALGLVEGAYRSPTLHILQSILRIIYMPAVPLARAASGEYSINFLSLLVHPLNSQRPPRSYGFYHKQGYTA